MILVWTGLILAEAPTHSGVSFKIENVNTLTAPFVVAYAQCFEDAAVATKALSQDERRRRYDDCLATRPALVKRFESTPGHQRAARNLAVSMNRIESAFAKALTSASQSPDKVNEATK